jgi:hypothetical protein
MDHSTTLCKHRLARAFGLRKGHTLPTKRTTIYVAELRLKGNTMARRRAYAVASKQRMSVPDDLPTEQRFQKLAGEWSRDTWHISSPKDLTNHPKYRQVIDLGWDVVPSLLRELHRTDRFWFTALSEITHLRPFDPKDAGNVKRMTDAWLDWGRKKGLI